jgi:hypothetical protein
MSNVVIRPSSFFFPLRTNAEAFNSAAGYTALTNRIKQAILLYDDLLFEAGLYTGFVTEGGYFDNWHPPTQLSLAMLNNLRASHKPSGGEAALFVQAVDSTDAPMPLIQGEALLRYHSEFHTLLSAFELNDCSFIHMQPFGLTDYGKEEAKELRKELTKVGHNALLDTHERLKSLFIKQLSQDLVICSDLEMPFSMASFYAPLLKGCAGIHCAPGFTAFQVAVPDVSHLCFEEILRLREQDCAVELRKKLFELEERVALAMSQGEVNEVERIVRLQQAFIDELIREIRANKSSKARSIINLMLDFILSFAPSFGPLGVGFLTSAAKEYGKITTEQRSWKTALLQLNKSAL